MTVIGSPYGERERNSAFARLRIRQNLRSEKFHRLLKIGELGPVLCGGLLIGFNNGKSIPLSNHWASYDVMSNSQVFIDLPMRSQQRFLRTKYGHYTRLEEAFNSFGSNLIIAIPDPNDVSLGESLYKVKLWFINFGLYNPDDAIGYLKWIGKSCMSVALGKGPQPGLSSFPGYNAKLMTVVDTPFKGCLGFIHDLFVNPSAEEVQLTLEQYRILAQISGISRALPYPSDRQIRKSVSESIALIYSEPPKMQKEDKQLYIAGLDRITSVCKEPSYKFTHLSLSASACLESARSQGGRGLYLMEQTKCLSRLVIDSESAKQIVGLKDCYNRTILSYYAFAKLESLNYQINDRGVYLGDFAYVESPDLTEHLERLLDWKHEVPKELGQLLVLTASLELLDYGKFNKPIQPNKLNLPLFKASDLDTLEYLPNMDAIPVRAALSIESGMKTRLVTAAPAGVTTVLQTLRHNISGWLSNDLMLKLGFFEPDKLWEVLKTYRKYRSHEHGASDRWIMSTDLKEATYHFPFEVMDLNTDFICQHFARHPVVRVFKRLIYCHSRLIDLTDIIDKGYAEDWVTELVKNPTIRGSFMGDSLSFMHLTLSLASCSWQAAYAAYSKQPLTKMITDKRHLSRPLGQIVGDDNLAIAAPKRYCEEFRHRISLIGLEISKIDADSRFFGVFCEQAFCYPRDGESTELATYAEDSRFGDLYFLDIIKGSILANQAKVKADGSDPLLGHLKMARKQIQWHPIPRIRALLPVVLWALGLPKTIKLGDVKPWFPAQLGGLEIALGDQADLDNRQIDENYGQYVQGILELPFERFFEQWSALQSISMGASKGVPWDPGSIDLGLLVSKITLIKESEFTLDIPEYVRNSGNQAKLLYAKEQLGIVPLRLLHAELTELAAFKSFWDGVRKNPSPLTLTVKGLRERFKTVWSRIRTEVQPKQVDPRFKTLKHLGDEMGMRTWGMFYSVHDPAIEEFFNGMTNLSVKIGDLNPLGFNRTE